MSDSTAKTVFRTSMRGFNKADVNKYIYNENRRFEALEKGYVSTIASLREELSLANEKEAQLTAQAERLSSVEAELEAARLRVAALEEELLMAASLSDELRSRLALSEENASSTDAKHASRLSALEADISDKNDKLSDAAAALHDERSLREAAEAECSSLTAQVEDLRTLLSQRETEVGILRGEIEGLKQTAARMADRPYISPRDTAVNETYVEAEASAKELLRRAKEAADDMLRRAEISSGRLLERAQSRAVACRAEMVSTARDLLASVSGEVHRSIDECTEDFVRGIRDVYTDSGLSTTDDDFTRREDELARRISAMQSEFDRSIEERIAEFDRLYGSDN